jgi:hypothetical protein
MTRKLENLLILTGRQIVTFFTKIWEILVQRSALNLFLSLTDEQKVCRVRICEAFHQTSQASSLSQLYFNWIRVTEGNVRARSAEQNRHRDPNRISYKFQGSRLFYSCFLVNRVRLTNNLRLRKNSGT